MSGGIKCIQLLRYIPYIVTITIHVHMYSIFGFITNLVTEGRGECINSLNKIHHICHAMLCQTIQAPYSTLQKPLHKKDQKIFPLRMGNRPRKTMKTRWLKILQFIAIHCKSRALHEFQLFISNYGSRFRQHL